MLNVGDSVPEFSLESGTGERVASSALLGSRWVIYFYPKDNTPGCTVETTEFGKVMGQLADRGVRVFGCSVGDVAAKKSFAESCEAADLPLLADPDHAVAEGFGVWGERKFAGREYMGIARTTFLVGADGLVKRVWAEVKPEGHAAEVVAATAS
ncbi:MAG TPA: peroxiredoxin [Candidatus Dormibacteraeota bacterium]|nr:peroxiredoxin [Candidatus Dormibacteraeota bacterium]